MPGAKRLVFLVISFAKAPAKCAIPLNFLPQQLSQPEHLSTQNSSYLLSFFREIECSLESYLQDLLDKHKELDCPVFESDDIKKVITECHLWSFDATPTEWHKQVWDEMQNVNKTNNTVFVF